MTPVTEFLDRAPEAGDFVLVDQRTPFTAFVLDVFEGNSAWIEIRNVDTGQLMIAEKKLCRVIKQGGST